MAYWFYRWDWGEAIGLEGLDAWAAKTGRAEFSDFVTEMLDHWLEASDGPPSRFGPAICLLSRFDVDGGRYGAFARRVGDVFCAAPIERGAVLLDGPSCSIFVDSLCGDPAFLMALARRTGDARYAVRGHEILLGHCNVLQDPATGLFGHFADLANNVVPNIPWARGNGWAALGLANYLAVCPEGSKEHAEALERFVLLCDGLRRRRVPGGGWRNLIDRPESYPESSSTVLIAHAMTLGVSNGWLDPEWRSIADEAWSVVEHRIDPSGHLINVSYRPGINTDPSRYEHAPALGGAYPWAQGPYLLAAASRCT